VREGCLRVAVPLPEREPERRAAGARGGEQMGQLARKRLWRQNVGTGRSV